MKSSERQNLILSILKGRESISVSELIEMVPASPATIRRDIVELSDTGVIRRTHGKVLRGDGHRAPEYEMRDTVQNEEKQLIGKFAASLVKENDTIFIDAGTTTLAMAQHLKPLKKLCVITNSIPIAEELNGSDLNVFMPGGLVEDMCVADFNTVQYLAEHIADKAFIGASGVRGLEGLTVSSSLQFAVKRQMVASAREVYALLDSEKFHITESHYYRMTVDLLDSTLLCEKTDGQQPDYDQLFFVGDATGWNFEEMTKDPLDPFLFRYGKVFDAAGEFKFGTASGSWENMFKAVTYHQGYTDPSVTLINGFDPDNKWYLNAGEAGKAYKICFDIRAGKERMMMKEFKPYEMIYLVGDATPNGWDLGNATAMTATTDPMVFTWTGNLQAGELKFSLDKQSDWNGAWLMCASGNDVAPTGNEEHALLINKSDEYQKEQYLDNNIGDVDQKWKITSSGTYTITVNQLKETVTIVKQ